MANWGVVLARRPSPYRQKKHTKQHAASPSLILEGRVDESMGPRNRNNGNIFKNLCSPDAEEHDCETEGCERITINVSGMYFITKRKILELHPNTVLGDPKKRRHYYDHMREEYFFDRHRPTFESIFNYYQYGGKLKRPASVSDDVFLEECEFFEVEEEVLKAYKIAEGYTETKYSYPSNLILAKVWALFEYPETSRMAFIIGILSVIATIVSIVIFTVETLPRFQENCEDEKEPTPKDASHGNFSNSSISNSTQNITGIGTSDENFDYKHFFFVLETICNIWFTIEATVRFISCPNHLNFCKDIKNIIDVMAIVPYYIALAQMLDPNSTCDSGNVFAFLRVIRLIRVFKLTKHSEGLQILLLTFQSSMEGLTLFVLTLMVCMLVFSSMIYYCEIGQDDTMIKSIPGGFWWAVITMCTVGYGDVVPVGDLGKMVGAVCALSGVLTLAIPVPIITENFNKFYEHKQRSMSKSSSSLSESTTDKAKGRLTEALAACRQKICCRENTDIEAAPQEV